jgi:general secretion pathway protein H
MISRRCRPVRSKGFTLVEILVVLVIMALIISIAVLSIGTTGRDQQLDEETRRIQGLVDLLHERALLEGRDFGLRIEPTAYEFVVYSADRDRWLTLTDESEFRRRDLPKGVTFELELDSVQVVLKPIDKTFSTDEPPPPPQVAIAASGEGTPFRLTLLRDATQARASVDGDAFGKTSHESSDQRQAEKRS